MVDFPKAPINRILRKYNPRVSENSINALAEIVENILEEVSSGAADIRQTTDRKTVKDSDVITSAKLLGLY